MKHILLFILCALFTYQNLYAFTQKSLDELQRFAFLHPKETLSRLDSLENCYDFPSYKLGYLRACSQYALAQFNKAMQSIRSVYEMPDLSSDSILQKRVCMIYAETAVLSFSLQESMSCILKGKEIAWATKDTLFMSRLLIPEAALYRTLGLNQKAYKQAITAANLSLKLNEINLETITVQFRACLWLMTCYIEDEKFKDAMFYAQKIQNALDKFSKKINQCDFCDIYSSLFYGKMAYLTKMIKKDNLSDLYYQRYKNTSYSKTFSGKQRLNDYLLLVGRYDEVLSNTEEYMQNVINRDTLNLFYVEILNNRCDAFIKKEDYKQAYRISQILNKMQNYMLVNKDKDVLFETADVDKINSLINKLKKSQQSIVIYQIILATLTIIVLVIFFLLGKFCRKVIYRYYKKKLNYLIGRFGGRIKDEKGQSFPSSNTIKKDVDTISDAELFNRFNIQVRKEKLFLDYQLGRDDYARIMKVDKNRFASIIRAHSGGNMSTYINNLRLEYSTNLLKENAELSIAEIATRSAIPNVSTYYRLFKEKYGISPAEYRNQLK